MDKIGIEYLRSRDWVVQECISGSRAYGLAGPASDTDIKGVFVMPKKQFYGLEYIEQVSNPTNDIVFYELKRFVELLAKNNPNILELLATPQESVIYRHPLMNLLAPELFLSKLCLESFVKYAMAQIRKARGLNKKVLNPMTKERKTVLDFCFVVKGQNAQGLKAFLQAQGLNQEECGLSKIAHMSGLYGMYIEKGVEFRGIWSSEIANDVCLSSIPKGMRPLALMSFNLSAYSQYCKDYKEYWEWVENRNETRYQNTISHQKNYDSKNMMHTFRLLDMAEVIAKEKQILVKSERRDFLLSVKNGDFEYDYLLKKAELKTKQVEEAFHKSSLPDSPNMAEVDRLLVNLRDEFYTATTHKKK